MVHAVLLGGTGATGKELLSQMLQDEAFKRIVTIGMEKFTADGMTLVHMSSMRNGKPGVCTQAAGLCP